MKGKYTNFIICTITIIFFIEIFDHTKFLINCIYQASSLWFFNLLPVLFPFFIITDILTNYGFVDFISKAFGKIMYYFKLKKSCAYAFFLSMFSGFPGNSKLIKELLDKNEIDEYDASKLLTFNHFSNPLFIIGTIGVTLLNNKKIGIIILLTHFITNFIVGFLFRNIYITNTKSSIKENKSPLPFMNVLNNSITNSINTLLLIYGIIVFTTLLINIISINLNISSFKKAMLTGLIEITQGLSLIAKEPINIAIKASIMTLFISFGGISIHMQVMSILTNYKINYYPYFLSRIIHAIISSSITYLLVKLFT